MTGPVPSDPSGAPAGGAGPPPDPPPGLGSGGLFGAIVDTVREPLLVLDADLRVVRASRSFARAFGMEREEAEGRCLGELGGGGWDDPQLRDLLARVAERDGSVDDFEAEHSLPGGGRRLLLVNARRVRREDGGPPLLLLSIEDVTERREAQRRLQAYARELERSNRELEQFAYVASHDLQEPLRMVAGFTELLAQRYRGRLDAEADEFIAFAVDGASRMQRLIQDLLTYSRVGTRGRPFQPVDCAALLARTLNDLRPALEEVDGTVSCEDPLPTVPGDQGQLGLLLQNLLANALKFHGPQPPRVEIRARPQEDEWLFSVRDNGIGIEPRYFDRIFGIFQRLHTRVEYPGTGIGLAVARRIVERHGGRIWVESSPGAGSTFHFTLSAVDPSGERPESEEA